MKKLILIFLSISVILSVKPYIPVTAEPAGYEYTTVDALYILRHAAGIIKLSDEQANLYDLNGDGKITTADALYILKIVAAIEPAPVKPDPEPPEIVTPKPPPADEIINTWTVLHEHISYAGENFNSSVKVRLKSISVWNDLISVYNSEPEYYIVYGIKDINLSYLNHYDYISATIYIEYDMYANIASAYLNKNTSSLSSAEKLVYNKAVGIIGSIQSNSTVYEKEKFINDYLVNNIVYDLKAANAFDVYGALIDGRAVCQGIAQAFKMFMDMLNIESLLVYGTAGSGRDIENHAWNLIKIGGSWYHIDVTWNLGPPITYNYYNVSDSTISKNHYWNKDNYPSAPADGVKPENRYYYPAA
jgi:hypothetical protein